LKVKAIIEYDGSKFNGFQIQKHTSNTVVEHISKTLLSVGINSKIVGSGRTDKNVHASFQVIDFNIPTFWQQKNLIELKYQINKKLKYIQFKYITITNTNFHSQYSAKTRVYRYIIKTVKPKVFEKDYVSYYKIDNLELFATAINSFEGVHNFKYFKKEGSFTSSDIREIYKTKVIKLKDYIIVYFFANGYLRSQIRLMIAGAIEVENKKLTISQLKEQIDAKQRFISKPSCPSGLYLARVFY